MKELDESKVYNLKLLNKEERNIFLQYLKNNEKYWHGTTINKFNFYIKNYNSFRFLEEYNEWVFSNEIEPNTNAKELFTPQYEVKMIAEKPKHPLSPVIERAIEMQKELFTDHTEHNLEMVAYKEKANKLDYELDFNFITQLAERMNANKGKYEPYNWQKIDNIEDLKQALFRHVIEVMKGNYQDDNRTYGHLEAIALNCMFINYQLNNETKDL